MIRLVFLRRKIFICTIFALLGYLFCHKFLFHTIRRLKLGRIVFVDNFKNAIVYGPDAIYLENFFNKSHEEQVPQKLLQRQWFMPGGDMLPQPSGANRSILLWPEEMPGSDRVLDQLMFVPHNYSPTGNSTKEKKILIYHPQWMPKYLSWNDELEPGWFKKNRCPVDTCTFTKSRNEANVADLVITMDDPIEPNYHRPPGQIWMFFMHECPYLSKYIEHKDVYNWTATYRPDSDIPEVYGKWVYFNNNERYKDRPDKNYADGKSKLVAAFISFAYHRNQRLEYAHELQKYIQVDIYGERGTLKCPKTDSKACFKMLDTTYKFYLAFENSNCINYITEKLFVNGLQHNVIPIVMGARQEDYANVAPFHSYIHVEEFDSPKALAKYLHKLDKDDELYNSYFLWKGTGEFINSNFFCRVCAMLHADHPDKSYHNINEWWRPPNMCTRGPWKEFKNNDTKMIMWREGNNWSI